MEMGHQKTVYLNGLIFVHEKFVARMELGDFWDEFTMSKGGKMPMG